MKKLLIGVPLLGVLLWGATSGNIRWTQLRSADRHGTAATGQASDGTGTSGNCAKFDASGNVTDAGAACGSGSTVTIASGTSAMGTSAIASTACATVVTTSATGTASTDTIIFTPNGSIKAITGYVPATTGGLTIAGYPTTNNVNWDVCNWSSGSLTPSALTLNWRVVR